MTTRARTSWVHTSRRGVGLLEAVLSVLLLGMVASTVASSVAFLRKTQERQAQSLGAAELANRLIVQYLDEKDTMPSETLAVDYDRWRYRWRLELTDVGYKVDPAGQTEGDRRSGVPSDRIKMITISVWLSESSGGKRGFDVDVPSATLSRVFDPLAIFRNPDSTKRKFESEEGILEYIGDLRMLDEGRGGAP